MSALIVGGHVLIAILALLFFAALVKTYRDINEREARIEREEARIKDDIRAMTLWYRGQPTRKDAQAVEAFLAEL